MNRLSLISICGAAALVAAGVIAQQPGLRGDLASLIAAEKAFAQMSAEQGTREAFLNYLADDSVLFRPHPVNGKKWMEEHPDQSGLLTWRPAFADISRSGDFGYTTGPYELRKDKADKKPFRTGSFVSVWRRQADGKWKVLIDTGVVYPQSGAPPKAPTATANVRLPARVSAAGGDKAEAGVREKLLELDRAFAKEAARRGAAAFLDYLSADARLLRADHFPLATPREVRAFLAEQKGLLSWRPTDAEVSGAGDLGYTYGLAEYLPPRGDTQTTEHSYYLRIWKKQPNGEWRVALDVATPSPPPAVKP
jgi:ketosteroid isomerase-like protein